MRTDLTHPWGIGHRPNLLHRPGLTPADEAPELSFHPVQFLVQDQTVVQVDLGAFTRSGAVPMATGTGNVTAMVAAGGYLYAAYSLSTLARSPTDPATEIAKIDPTTLTVVDKRSIPVQDPSIDRIAALASDGAYLYVALETTHRVIKIDLTQFSTGTISASSYDGSFGTPYALAVSGGSLFVGLHSGLVGKFDTAFTKPLAVQEVSAGAKVAGNVQALLVHDGHLAAGLSGSPGEVDGVDPTTLMPIWQKPLEAKYNDVTSLAEGPCRVSAINYPTAKGGFSLYAGLNTQPGRIRRLHLNAVENDWLLF